MAKTLLALIASLCIAFSAAAAQSDPKAKKPTRPAWSELSPSQQQVLAPLQGEWDNFDSTRRKNWVSIADRYPTMKPAEQQRLKKRMQEWAQLTPEERRAAREQYQTLKKLPSRERKEVRQRWQEYQQSLAPPEPATAAHPDPATAETPPSAN